ncbi:MAG: hypothetical protein ACRDPA_09320, partial [Solirubrobacteraceae bacterium]
MSDAYRSAGVDYETLDACKRSALSEALATSGLLSGSGGRALDESRGEPAFVFEAARRSRSAARRWRAPHSARFACRRRGYRSRRRPTGTR